jgi:hypothetical protein
LTVTMAVDRTNALDHPFCRTTIHAFTEAPSDLLLFTRC